MKEGVFPQNSSESDEKVQQQHESSVKVMLPKRTSGKNKRGERGSTDDEIADLKRVLVNMVRGERGLVVGLWTCIPEVPGSNPRPCL